MQITLALSPSVNVLAGGVTTVESRAGGGGGEEENNNEVQACTRTGVTTSQAILFLEGPQYPPSI